MKNVPPSVRAALNKRGRSDILNQEGDYINYKAQIDQIIHSQESMPLETGDDNYEMDVISPEEKKANEVIERYGEKYRTGKDEQGRAFVDDETGYRHFFNNENEANDYAKRMNNANDFDLEDWQKEIKKIDEEVREYISNYDFTGEESYSDVIDIIKNYDASITNDQAKDIANEIWNSGKVNGMSRNNNIEDAIALANDELTSAFDEDIYEDDLDEKNTPAAILEKNREIKSRFNMPESEGWKETSFGEKSFIKNEGTDHEMFIQYNGDEEYVAGYMKDGEYITKKFNNLGDAEDFVDNAPVKELQTKPLTISKEDLIYEGEDSPDISWLQSHYNVDIKYNGDSKGSYSITGDAKDLEKFAKDHNIKYKSQEQNDINSFSKPVDIDTKIDSIVKLLGAAKNQNLPKDDREAIANSLQRLADMFRR